jgi:hypothetical protein
MKLSKNFWLSELTNSRTAKLEGIKNNPSSVEIDNLKRLCENVLQPTRDYIGEPININSGFRSKKLNTAIGGSKTSSHMKGEASDIESGNDTNNVEMFCFIADNLDFDQLIIYKSTEGRPRFVHVSYAEGNNRNQTLLKRDGGGYELTNSDAVKEEFPDWT